MNVIAAFMVVILHAGEPQMIGSSGWWWVEIFKTVSKVAVPYFFVAAGFFLAGHIDESGWWRKEVVKRMRTLMIPFVTWSLLWWSFYLPFGIYADYLHSRELGSSLSLFEGKWTKILGLNLFQCPFYSPMWFLRALFLMVVASPVVSYIVKRSGGGGG
ncbi:MAG: acyltransferase family protein [Kiritimatiellae bacterium]|nr:acyltransferase family protein [Kiritimatiellia bacterium]